jgi:hypothetical protein
MNALEKNKAETIKTHLTALRSHHVDRGIPTEVFDDLRVKRILRGSQRAFGTTSIRERGEFTRDILLTIVATLSDSHDDVNFQAAFTVAFPAFVRLSEFTWDSCQNTHESFISRAAVQFPIDDVLLHLPNPKQINSGKGTKSPYPRPTMQDALLPPSSHCSRNTQNPTQNPCFQGTWVLCNKHWISDKLNSLLKAGYDPTIYSGNSFRRGVANSAIAAGTPTDEIKKMGR